MAEVDEDVSVEFKWLKKRGRGGKERKVQFYESFVYDGVEYVLYDCVYMYKEGLQEPYIGKLIKIWEHLDNKTKKVKVQWFFRPEEISMWLGDIKTLENEILFASGEGVGLANISPLEAIAGQCNVVCVSKDCRNPQPSDEELKAANFIFYRTFDVQSCTISDKMEEKVGEVEIKYVFNGKEGESISPFPVITADRKEENQNTTTTCGEEQPLLTKNLPNKLKGDQEDIKLAVKVDLKGECMPFGKDRTDKVEAKERNKTPVGYDKLHDQSLMKIKSDDKIPQQVEREVGPDAERLKDMPSKNFKAESSFKMPSNSKSKHEDKLSLNVNDLKASGTSGIDSEVAKIDSGMAKADKDSKLKDLPSCKDMADKNPMGSDKLHDRPLKKIKHDDKKPPEEKQVELEVARNPERLTDMRTNKSKVDSFINLPVNNLDASGLSGTIEEKPNQKNGKVVGSEKRKISAKVTDDVEGKTLKKTKADGSFRMPDNKKQGSVQKLIINTNGDNNKDSLATSFLKSGQALDSSGINKEPTGEQSGEIKRKLSMSISPKVSALSSDGNKKTPYQEFVVGPKPNADKSGWFIRLPWEERLKNAYDQGTAILLHNVDPDYTSGEVEDIIWHAFTENCEAKILQRTAVSSPHYCQALILFKTKEASQKVLSKLDEECLMLSNGRPLVGTTCPPIGKNSKFFGHLTIDKCKTQNLRDEAVSTSHFSQPNTIEYDMAMEWCLLQTRSKKWWEMIHKQQGNELKKLQTDLVRK